MRVFKVLALLAAGVAAGAFWSRTQAARQDDEAMELYGAFVDAVEQVQANYVQPVDRKVLVESALRGMIDDLDPHSAYFNNDDWKQFQKQVEGSYTGIGVQLDLDRQTGRPLVVAPLVGSPAYAAGVLAGDQILEVNGKSTEDWNREQVAENLSGRPGTDITLKVQHPAGGEPEVLTLRRAQIELDTVMGDRRGENDAWNFFLDRDQKIAYIRITSFTLETASDLRAALDSIEEQGARGLILDLRDDPGGLLSAAVEVSDLLLESGKIVTTRGRNVRERGFEARREGTFDMDRKVPIAVLVNGHSASAAEIVAAALQDNQRAKVVGQRSYGKGSVQNIVALENGNDHLKLTVATYFRPSEKNIHRFKDAKPTDEWGVSPDAGHEVPQTDEQYVEWARMRQKRDMISRANPDKTPAGFDLLKSDPPLAKAMDVIREALDGKP